MSIYVIKTRRHVANSEVRGRTNDIEVFQELDFGLEVLNLCIRTTKLLLVLLVTQLILEVFHLLGRQEMDVPEISIKVFKESGKNFATSLQNV